MLKYYYNTGPARQGDPIFPKRSEYDPIPLETRKGAQFTRVSCDQLANAKAPRGHGDVPSSIAQYYSFENTVFATEEVVNRFFYRGCWGVYHLCTNDRLIPTRARLLLRDECHQTCKGIIEVRAHHHLSQNQTDGR